MKCFFSLQNVQSQGLRRCRHWSIVHNTSRVPTTIQQSLLQKTDRKLTHNHAKHRQRRDDIWIPVTKLKTQTEVGDATDLLIRAGYIRQAYSGIYHVLPLGLRVQTKLELLIDKHMQSVGGSKVSLSSISSQALWERSGRLQSGSELFTFSDRKDSKWLLAPTHEEEITNLVRHAVQNPSQLPVRLYQISRKYRDEKRPRGGLLRGREFIMKDLYTFDATKAEAHATYDQVRKAYRNFLDELTVPYIEARADSGNMGGTLSHEYHFPNDAGEDDVISCTSCSYARNEEWVPECSLTVEEVSPALKNSDAVSLDTNMISTSVIATSRSSLVKAFAPQTNVNDKPAQFNMYSIKSAMDSLLKLDTGIEQPLEAFLASSGDDSTQLRTVYYLFDQSISKEQAMTCVAQDRRWRAEYDLSASLVMPKIQGRGQFSLLKQEDGDHCPQCADGILKVQKAIEVGHTFHLGTRYSSKLGLAIKPDSERGEGNPVEMGCHGIGVSRLLAAVASSLSDTTGLNWPAVIAPYQVVIIVDGQDGARVSAATHLYDSIISISNGQFDVLLDDRRKVSTGYKLKDADLIGYPIIVIIGRTFLNGQVEVQCRMRGVKKLVDMSKVSTEVSDLLLSLLTTV